MFRDEEGESSDGFLKDDDSQDGAQLFSQVDSDKEESTIKQLSDIEEEKEVSSMSTSKVKVNAEAGEEKPKLISRRSYNVRSKKRSSYLDRPGEDQLDGSQQDSIQAEYRDDGNIDQYEQSYFEKDEIEIINFDDAFDNQIQSLPEFGKKDRGIETISA